MAYHVYRVVSGRNTEHIFESRFTHRGAATHFAQGLSNKLQTETAVCSDDGHQQLIRPRTLDAERAKPYSRSPGRLRVMLRDDVERSKPIKAYSGGQRKHV